MCYANSLHDSRFTSPALDRIPQSVKFQGRHPRDASYIQTCNDFYPAKPLPWLIRSFQGGMQFVASRFLNFHCAIPNAEINRLQSIQKQTGASILALNHSSLADSFSIQALAYQANLTPVTMAALENFDRKIANISYKIIWPIAARLGYFSVNRGNQSIQKSTDHVQEILGKGKNPLLIFPEGRISWQNQQVGACQNGALRLALQTSQTKGQTIRVLPIGIGYHYLPQAKGQVLKLLTQNEKKWYKAELSPASLTVQERITRLLNSVLERQEQTYHLNQQARLPWHQRLGEVQQAAIQRLSEKYKLPFPSSKDASQQIRHLFKTINQRQIDLKPPSGWSRINPWSQAYKLYQKARQETQSDIQILRDMEIIMSLESPTQLENDTSQQMEALLKLFCLIQGKRPSILTIVRNCKAQIRVGEPIVISPKTLNKDQSLIAQANQLTTTLHQALQQSVDEARTHSFSDSHNPV